MKERIAVYPGSFDPFTNGHLNVLYKAVELFDKIYIVIASNESKNSPCFSVKTRRELIEKLIESLKPMATYKSIEIEVTVLPLGKAVVDLAVDLNATHIIRGLRNTNDFEQELELAIANKELDNSISTVYIIPDVEHMHTSSSKFRAFISLAHTDAAYDLLPPIIQKKLKEH